MVHNRLGPFLAQLPWLSYTTTIAATNLTNFLLLFSVYTMYLITDDSSLISNKIHSVSVTIRHWRRSSWKARRGIWSIFGTGRHLLQLVAYRHSIFRPFSSHTWIWFENEWRIESPSRSVWFYLGRRRFFHCIEGASRRAWSPRIFCSGRKETILRL